MRNTRNTQPTEKSTINDEQISGSVEDTLMAHIERVVNIAIKCKLCDSVYTKAEDSLNYLSKRLNLTPRQALLFALFMELSHYSTIWVSQISNLTDCRHVRILSLLGEDKALIARKLIRPVKDDDENAYRVPKVVVSAIKNNDAMLTKREALNIDAFFERLSFIIDGAEDCHDNLSGDINELIDDNMHLPFCQAFRKHFGDDDSMESEGILFMIFAHRLVNEEDDCIGEHNWNFYFPKYQVRHLRKTLSDKSSFLLTQNLFEELGSEGMRDNYFYHISPMAKDEFFVGMEGMQTAQTNVKELQTYTTLSKKQLFYNEREGEQIAKLSSLISISKFGQVQKRLESIGMRKGFACLFYGAPGTGKTETVYQLARKTKRDLFVIDVAKIKSCWVGESEKNITQAFVNYRNCVKRCRKQGKNIPILLFNEADAVLGIRKEGAESAVDKMENSIQNIILQEMERLDGIMIATTNLTTNLDKAFERRFIYKIEFGRPSVEARCSIWKSMIPRLNAKVALQLATDFEFTGGQIENVARKSAVDMVLSGKRPTAEQLRAYGEHEILNNGHRARIGF